MSCKSLHSPVTISYLTLEELGAYRKRPRSKYYDHDNRRLIDWRWPEKSEAERYVEIIRNSIALRKQKSRDFS